MILGYEWFFFNIIWYDSLLDSFQTKHQRQLLYTIEFYQTILKTSHVATYGNCISITKN